MQERQAPRAGALPKNTIRVGVTAGDDQLFESYRWAVRPAFDVSVRGDPGGIVAGNDAASWSTFTNGRVNGVSYAYGRFDIDRVTRLPASFRWVSHLSGLVAGQPLPDTEQLALGGFDAVRGYDLDDAGVDAGVIWRNELHLPTFSPLGKLTGGADSVSPYVSQQKCESVPRKDHAQTSR